VSILGQACSGPRAQTFAGDAAPDDGGATEGSTFDFDARPPDGGLTDGEVCAAEKHSAVLIPLTFYLMLDQSGSMYDFLPNGQTKIDALAAALGKFFQDPKSAGMGAAGQIFPLAPGPLPTVSCSVDGECGPNGKCMGGVCNPFVCTADAQCGPYGFCFQPPTVCMQDWASCVDADYATPRASGTLPAVATALLGVLGLGAPVANAGSGTPTAPALRGAIDYMKSWKTMNPKGSGIVVLATDGEPNECDPGDVAGVADIAGAGFGGTPSVPTFVLGVGGDLTSLDAVAQKGGTGNAFLVDLSANAVTHFTAALNALRLSAVACTYQIPMPQNGAIDFQKVNVDYTPSGGSTVTLPYVGSPSSCDANGGWTYDDPAHPTEIILCDSSCNALKKDPFGEIEILLGCATVIK
jgi:hypothetical protein